MTNIRVRVLVLVLASDQPSVLFVRRLGENGPVLPGGYVRRGASLASSASGYLYSQCRLAIPIARGLVVDQEMENFRPGELETHTYVMAGAYVRASQARDVLPLTAQWVSVASQLRAPGIVKYAIHAAISSEPGFTVLLNSEGTEEERRMARQDRRRSHVGWESDGYGR